MLSESIQEQLRTAANKVLATNGPEGINVVPVSAITVTAETITLYNFYMDKTVANITAEPQVALSAWTDFIGIQVKAIAKHKTSGEGYEVAVREMKEKFPNRTLKGIIVLTPTVVYDVSADVSRAGRQLS